MWFMEAGPEVLMGFLKEVWWTLVDMVLMV